jgi:alginate O-acetyltransferase complex protein AlgI
MVFCSPLFLFLFLPIVLTVYLLLPGIRSKNFWLLCASLIFYAWGEISFVFLLLASTVMNYGLGLWIGRSEIAGRRKLAVAVAVVINVGILCVFKYAGLIVHAVNSLCHLTGASAIREPNIPLPIGISFFTFHALSYVIDIYRRKWSPARDPKDVALYIFFFPQLVAGPILRWNAIAPQLLQRNHRTEIFAEGVRRFVGGLAKKMIIANAVALPADQIFALSLDELSPATAWFGIVCYTIQIYFDFSGYSDMAVGLGKMFGFTFIENFNFPYTSQSIRDFWRRWHISLSTWFRDYVYIPLGGNRVTEARNRLNLVIVFFLCGLWHGASWTFVAWGLYHGFFLVVERTGFGAALEKVPRPLRHGYALFVVMMGWVLFRANTFPEAANYFAALFGMGHPAHIQPLARYAGNEAIWALCLGTVFSALQWNKVKNYCAQLAGKLPDKPQAILINIGTIVEILLILALLLISAAWLAGGTYNPFIYFRF